MPTRGVPRGARYALHAGAGRQSRVVAQRGERGGELCPSTLGLPACRCSPEKAGKFQREVRMYVWEEEVDGRQVPDIRCTIAWAILGFLAPMPAPDGAA